MYPCHSFWRQKLGKLCMRREWMTDVVKKMNKKCTLTPCPVTRPEWKSCSGSWLRMLVLTVQAHEVAHGHLLRHPPIFSSFLSLGL